MNEPNLEFLFEIVLEVPEVMDLGPTPQGRRRIAPVTGGRFEGPDLRGQVLPGGADWVLIRADGVLQMDVRITLETDDGELIYMSYHGLRRANAEVEKRLAAGEDVDPSEYYFRTTPYFETGSEKYGWLNGIVSVGFGNRTAGGVVYQVHKVL